MDDSGTSGKVIQRFTHPVVRAPSGAQRPRHAEGREEEVGFGIGRRAVDETRIPSESPHKVRPDLAASLLMHVIGAMLRSQCRKSMARIKYVLNERRLALIATAESLRPVAQKVHGSSPLGRADPMSLTGWEKERGFKFEPVLPGSQLGDGERQKRDIEHQEEAIVEGESVAKEEIEGRDEGFGSGKEAEEFVKAKI